MPAAMTLVRRDAWRTETGPRIGRAIFNLTGLTGGNDTIAFPSGILPAAPLAVSYEGTGGQPASSWKAADASNLYVICAAATANAIVEYASPQS
jgi:hypothetical protein